MTRRPAGTPAAGEGRSTAARRSSAAALPLAAVLLAGAIGCSQAPAPESVVENGPASGGEIREVTGTQAVADAAAAPGGSPDDRSPAAAPAVAPSPPATAPAASLRPSAPPTVIVVGGGEAQERPTPAEAAAAARAARTGEPRLRIDNRNLSEIASRGQLTIGGPPAAADPPKAAEAVAAEADTETGADAEARGEAHVENRDETYWRRRARELREGWAATAEEIAALEEEIARLRWQFYAEDDPWVRDGRVKPAWDRALERLREARSELDEYPQRLEALLDEGRRAGALPGWLREGVELEPPPPEEQRDARDPLDPIEPPQAADPEQPTS